jgi:uncharacterized protein
MNNDRATIGILSDTHRSRIDDEFQNQVDHAFSACDAIVHAGDLTSASIIDAFGERPVYAVHGNMCGFTTRSMLPDSVIFTIVGHRIGLNHGDGAGYDIEAGLMTRFPDADCIIYGHTHRPAVQRFSSVLIINPGTFRSSGRYGSPGTYAILNIDATGLSAKIHTLPAGQRT